MSILKFAIKRNTKTFDLGGDTTGQTRGQER